MTTPGKHSEIEEFEFYLRAQIGAIRNAAYGLTDEQARATPCRSSLSIGGLIKHAAYVLQGRLDRIATGGPGRELTQEGVAAFMGSFVLGNDETLAQAIAALDDLQERYLESVRSCDPTDEAIEPSAPWDGVIEPTTTFQRFYLMHHVEELARHAGHADIIREQLDGADAASLSAAVEGRPANAFVKPWTRSG